MAAVNDCNQMDFIGLCISSSLSGHLHLCMGTREMVSGCADEGLVLLKLVRRAEDGTQIRTQADSCFQLSEMMAQGWRLHCEIWRNSPVARRRAGGTAFFFHGAHWAAGRGSVVAKVCWGGLGETEAIGSRRHCGLLIHNYFFLCS